ncbi:MAG: hydrogenase maturation protease [Desulfobacterales bacterium]|nr:hydrogenase maturation protease [Desulfobacterales bacterium]
MILGIGSILFSDDGFGIQVAQKIEQEYEFPDNVLVVDGGVLGINLLGVISKPKHLIVVDTMRNKGAPRRSLPSGGRVPSRSASGPRIPCIQVDFLEALTLCQALDNVPKTVIIGVEPRGHPDPEPGVDADPSGEGGNGHPDGSVRTRAVGCVLPQEGSLRSCVSRSRRK